MISFLATIFSQSIQDGKYLLNFMAEMNLLAQIVVLLNHNL